MSNENKAQEWVELCRKTRAAYMVSMTAGEKSLAQLKAHLTQRAAVTDAQTWKTIDSAPKSRDCGDGRVAGVYLLGFCPGPDVCNLESAVCVVWWEPNMKKGQGMWYGEGGFETHPTHWMPLPTPPEPQA